jgi:alanyl-tRNA synthetase
MQSDLIRSTFLDFFAARDHVVVPSASLIPIDPTLLLTGAGMVPFKPYMLGEEPAPFDRAVSIQKVGRTTDIEIVGTTARHLTFFEMLGNFSFGDYFKEKAIPWAYELVTDGFGLDPDRLWYTVHVSDDEAAEIWIDGVGVAADRLQRLDHENFWHMGVPGPCGPSSEIFYDKGPEFGEDGGPAVDDERFMEFWNLVFMQNIQDEPYHVVGDLPAKNIDTGAGLERCAVVLQGVGSIFDTDLIRPVIAVAERSCGLTYGEAEATDVSLRIMGDHARAVTALISDGVVPSNEGRGYVLRRLLRRSVRHAFIHGNESIMPDLVEATIATLGGAHQAMVDNRDYILETAEREEQLFRRTLRAGSALLDQALEDLPAGDVLPGTTAFKLHDTYGFPIDVTAEILDERGVGLDREGFDVEMDAQRRRARQAFRGGDDQVRQELYVSLLAGVDATEFIGYEEEAGTSTVLAVLRDGESVTAAEAGQDVEIFLDRTPFYGESGGQVGDTGTITSESGTVAVADTKLPLTGVHGHRGSVRSGTIHVGQEVRAEIDRPRRELLRKNHTGTHILHWALREIVGDHAHQAGSLVAPDRLRFDFSHYEGLPGEELLEVEQAVNERIIENARVTTIETTKAEAEEMGALAFFGDKYGERVRVVRTGSYSTEFCGGTHVDTTGQVGPLVLVSEGSVAANTRRVEALTGNAAYAHLVDLRRRIRSAEEMLRAQPGQLLTAVENLTGRLKDQEERIERFEEEHRSAAAGRLRERVEMVNEHSVVAAVVEDMGAGDLRTLAFQTRDATSADVGILASAVDGKGALIVWASEAVVDGGVSAGEIAATGAKALGGGGSRDPRLAQAGGPRGDQIEQALSDAREAAVGALAAL